MEQNKLGAYNFLKGLENHLNEQLPRPAYLRQEIPKVVKESKKDNNRKHTRGSENAFLYQFAFPILFDYIQTQFELSADETRNSLLSESYTHMPEYCLNTPARTTNHPFSKGINVNPLELMDKWSKGTRTSLTQSCPDFALKSPFPHKIVFEGKYFSRGGSEPAKRHLATGIYQTFFYRGLPYVKETSTRPAWDYDYACLFAYDASTKGALNETWNNINPKVKKGFWDGANIYVMILNGESRS